MSTKALLMAMSAFLAMGPAAAAQPARGGWMGPGMMGGGGMMGAGAQNRPVTPGWGGRILNHTAALAYIAYGNAHGAADTKANSVTFTGHHIIINLVAVQPGFDDQTFELHGLVNPTIIVPQGAIIQLNLLNMDYGDKMDHTVEIVTVPPPYPYMTMMYLGPPMVPPMPELPWRSEKNAQAAHYAALGQSFTASTPGTYWYVCPTPEHAEKGMFGQFVVR